MAIPIEPPRRQPMPRWAVVCWIASLHRELGRPDNAEMYLVELMGLAFEGGWWRA
jgi:hypothetical protein